MLPHMNSLRLFILGGISVICHAGDLVGVEWLVGKGSTGNEYYLAPTKGPFTTWNRYLAGYKGIPEGVVEYASVYVVSKDKDRQEKYEVAVNSKDLKSPCFSGIQTSSGSSVDQKVLDDINAICKNNGFHIHKTREYPLPAGEYFGALDPEHSLELNFNRGIPVNASLSGIKGDTLNFMAFGHLFVYAHVEGSDHVELVLPSRGVDASSVFGEGRVGRGNMKVWDNERKRRKRRKWARRA
ncbi:hypothetical protein FOZ63_010854 [Perkinsus olseni]|uniref:Uncharacterized protein n=1 Tax=Perkinsus olseni TaxID=32597 RepID=A0A7J6N4Q4_PEROL|nr:hypothetical protein FOZ63_010854 [Perkinsus olseni]